MIRVPKGRWAPAALVPAVLVLAALTLAPGCRRAGTGPSPADGQNPPAVPGAAELPVRDVDGLLDLIRSAPEIVITALDAPDLRTTVDAAGRERLAAAVRDGTRPGTPEQSESAALYEPFPAYRVAFRVPPARVELTWQAPHAFLAAYQEREGGPFTHFTGFLQPEGALWQAVAGLAPPPRFRPEEVGYLFGATALSGRVDGRELTDTPARRLGLVRELARGVPAAVPAPSDPPAAVLLFTVDGTAHEVQVWADRFTYAGRTYDRPGLLERLRQLEATP